MGGGDKVNLNVESLNYIRFSDNFIPDAIVNYIFKDITNDISINVSVIYEFDEDDDFHSVRSNSTNINYIKKTLNYNSMVVWNQGDNKVIVVRITYKTLSKSKLESEKKKAAVTTFIRQLNTIIKYIHQHMCEIYAHLGVDGGYILNRLNYVTNDIGKIVILSKSFIIENIIKKDTRRSQRKKDKDKPKVTEINNGNLGDIYEALTENDDNYYVIPNEKIMDTLDKNEIEI